MPFHFPYSVKLLTASISFAGSNLQGIFIFSLASPGGVLGLFGMKTGTHFLYFALESGIVFKGTRDNMNVFIVSIPNE